MIHPLSGMLQFQSIVPSLGSGRWRQRFFSYVPIAVIIRINRLCCDGRNEVSTFSCAFRAGRLAAVAERDHMTQFYVSIIVSKSGCDGTSGAGRGGGVRFGYTSLVKYITSSQ
jgi:hypothetical protein